jgi:di/tripeptidase
VLADPSLAVVRAIAGDRAGLNKIPTDFQLTLAAPAATDTASVRAGAEGAVRLAVRSHPGEATNPDVKVVVAEAPTPDRPITALAQEAGTRLFETVRAALNGVVTRKPGYPNQVNTSANLALLEVKEEPAAPDRRTVTFGFMVRSFSAEELGGTATTLVKHLSGLFASPVSIELLSGYDPWLEDPESWLVSRARALEIGGQRRFQKVGVQAIGVEPSYFRTKFPGIRIVGIGATITDAHTVHESVSIQSIREITATLDALLVRIAGADAFRTTPAPPPPPPAPR